MFICVYPWPIMSLPGLEEITLIPRHQESRVSTQQAGVPAPPKRAHPKFHDVRSSEVPLESAGGLKVGQAVLACPLFCLGSRPGSTRAERQASTACPTSGALALETARKLSIRRPLAAKPRCACGEYFSPRQKRKTAPDLSQDLRDQSDAARPWLGWGTASGCLDYNFCRTIPG